jgi:dephospho-CoA kinase
MRRIGLTGGIGSGKSTLGHLLQEKGLPLIDADAISRQLTQAGGEAIEPLQQVFGPQCIDPSGGLDRAHMRQLVFTNQDAKHRLEQVLHPLILFQIEKQVQACQARGNSLVVLDIPLLVESSHWRARVDRVLVVDCEEETQVHRVMQRSQLSAQAVHHIMANQASRHQRLSAADIVIYNNDNNMTHLRHQVDQLDLHI